ncbi:MAG: glycosyl hydrolase [Bacteroidota bacterium]
MSFSWLSLWLLLLCCGCQPQPSASDTEQPPAYYPSTKPSTRWWWFATEIKRHDIRHQLDWAKANHFGGVEVAWVYPLYRYQGMYARKYNRHYPKDTTAQQWLSPEWSAVVAYTKHYADSIGLACDFTFGSAWPVAGSNIGPEHSTQIYGDSTFRQLLTFAWSWPDTQLVINHLDSSAFERFAAPVGAALGDALKGSKSALFTDSWEIKLNGTNKIWTPGFDRTFREAFGYDIIPFMEQGLDSFPDVRYDYMQQLDRYVTNGFYKPYVETCRKLGAWSRVQCLASPTDVMTTYGMVDIPETEAMLNNPNYSRIVSSAAALSTKRMVSSESFTCMYGFPHTYLRQEQTADLKLVADALFAQGVNFHVYHGMPYNPAGVDSIDFFATTYFGPGGSLTPELPAFNQYIERVSGLMQQGKTYSDVAVYVPYEDGVMQGAYPKERQRVWVWGEYEMRYVHPPEELQGYHPLWINRHYLEEAVWQDGRLRIGDAAFSSLYVDVQYMDSRALERLAELAQQGLPICLKREPTEPSHIKSPNYATHLETLNSMANVSQDVLAILDHPPLIEGDSLPDYWCRKTADGSHYLFLSQWRAKDLVYPLYSGQSFMDKSDTSHFVLHVNGKVAEKTVVFQPYQSVVLRVGPDGNVSEVDISFVPKDPIIRPREKQRMYF